MKIIKKINQSVAITIMVNLNLDLYGKKYMQHEHAKSINVK